MHGSFAGGGYAGPRGFGDGRPGAGVWEAMEQLRTAFERRGGTRMGRGDVRAAVLALLAERPMHGYQIIQEIEERSGGAWKPSPGSVYPTLQLLADEGLISAEEANGRKTYALTEGGRAEAAMYWLIQLGALARLLAAVGPAVLAIPALLAAGLCWTLAFVLYAVVYAPYLWRARVDGREG